MPPTHKHHCQPGRLNRPRRGEHRQNLHPIDLIPPSTRRTHRMPRRTQDRITPITRQPQRRSGILDRHTLLDQPPQPITKSNTVLRKRHSRRNLSFRECCDDHVNPPLGWRAEIIHRVAYGTEAAPCSTRHSAPIGGAYTVAPR